jgi:hypothetical protein
MRSGAYSSASEVPPLFWRLPFSGRMAKARQVRREHRAKAVRLVREHAYDYDLEWAAMYAISARLWMTAETLREWVRQAEVDAGEAAGVPTETN